MSSKHHTSKAGRTHGAYRERLNARGLSKAPQMPSLDSLRKKQGFLPRGRGNIDHMLRELNRV